MSDAFYLSSSDRDKLRTVMQVVQGGNGSSRPLPRRRRGPRSLPGTSSTMLLVNVNQNIPEDQAEFTVDREYYTVIFGSEGREFITIDNSVFPAEYIPQTKIPVWKRESDGKYIPDRIGDDKATMLVVELRTQETGDFEIEDEYYRVVFGSEDREFIEVVNTQNETFESGAKVPCWKRPDGKYEPDRSGASGNPVVGFRLQADMAKDADYATAEIIDRFGNAGEEITVWNSNRQFAGRGPWTDPRGSHVGFRGFAVQVPGVTQNDRPLYRIITLEGMMRDIAVQLAADQNDAVADTPVVPLDITRYGHPWHGRFPEVVSATNQFTAQDPYGIAKGAKIGRRFLVKYSAPDDEYHFVSPIDAPTMLHVTLPSNTSDSQINVAQANYRVVFGQEDRSTITIDNSVWNEEFLAGDKVTVFKRPDGQYEADRAGGASEFAALHVTVPSDVLSSANSFTVPLASYRVIFGAEDRDPITVMNTFGESFTQGEKVTVLKRTLDGNYEPDRSGSGPQYCMVVVTPTTEQSSGSFAVGDSQYSVVFGAQDGTITIDNIFNETFPAGEKFTAFRRNDGEFVPDRAGEGGNAAMVRVRVPSGTSAATFVVPNTHYTVIYGEESRTNITVNNTYGESFISDDKVPCWRKTDGTYEPDRAGEGGDATMVVGQCIENVYDEDLSFSIANYTIVFGSEDRVLLPVNNRYGEEFQANEWVPCWRRSDGIYEPDRSGGGSTATMVKATVPSDTTSSFTTASYEPVFGSETRNSITVNNPYNESFKANDVIPCWRSGDGTYEPDRASVDLPTCCILSAPTVQPTEASFTAEKLTVVFGSEDQPTVQVYNTFDEAFENNEKFIAWKRSSDGYYEPDRGPRSYNTAVGTNPSAVTRNSTEVFLQNCTAVSGKAPPSNINATIPSYAKMDVPAGQQIYVRWNEGAGTANNDKWDTGDARNLDWMLRGKQDWSSTKYQVLVSNGPNESDRKWVEVQDQIVLTGDTSPSVEVSVAPGSNTLRVQLWVDRRTIKAIPVNAVERITVFDELLGSQCP